MPHMPIVEPGLLKNLTKSSQDLVRIYSQNLGKVL